MSRPNGAVCAVRPALGTRSSDCVYCVAVAKTPLLKYTFRVDTLDKYFCQSHLLEAMRLVQPDSTQDGSHQSRGHDHKTNPAGVLISAL